MPDRTFDAVVQVAALASVRTSMDRPLEYEITNVISRNHSVIDMLAAAQPTATSLVEQQAPHPADVPVTLAWNTAAGALLRCPPRNIGQRSFFRNWQANIEHFQDSG